MRSKEHDKNKALREKLKLIDSRGFTSDIAEKRNIQINLDRIKEMINRHVCDIGTDPLVDLISSLGDTKNPLAETHRSSWNLIRLLCLQALSRMGTSKPTGENGLPLFPLSENEVNVFVKLSQTVINSKKALTEVRKQKKLEEVDNMNKAINVTPVEYSKEELELMASIARKAKEQI